MSETVAIYGLGNMGYPLAKRVAAQFPVKVFDLDQGRLIQAEKEMGAQLITNPSDVADCHTVILCLPHPQISLAVLEQIRDHLPTGAVIVETSTVNPEDVQRSAKALEGMDLRLIDASILAGVSQMEAGTASLLLGGDPAAIATVKPVLSAIAEKQVSFGALGTGAAAKVINNAVAHAVMVVVAEAGSMATATGVDIQRLIGLLSDPEMGLHRPLTFRYAKRVVEGDYEGGMSLEAARKDSELALALAQKTGVPLFAIQASHSVYEMGVQAGHERDDYAAIAKLWAGWNKPAAPES
ncbi:MAG: NAD(P)-dependent oxidoreductase [Qingshengfaniella sp.]